MKPEYITTMSQQNHRAKSWSLKGKSTQHKQEKSRSVGKRMMVAFFGKRGIINMVMLEHQKTVAAKWYTETCLPQLMETLSNLRPKLRMYSWFLHHDNAPAHRAHATMDYAKKMGIKILNHRPYSPELAPCDFGLFPFNKMQLKGRVFATQEHIIAAFEKMCSKIPKGKWEQWFSDWFAHMNKCGRRTLVSQDKTIHF